MDEKIEGMEDLDKMFNELDEIQSDSSASEGNRDPISEVNSIGKAAAKAFVNPENVFKSVSESVANSLPSPISLEIKKAKEIHNEILEPLSTGLRRARQGVSNAVTALTDLMPEIPGVSTALRKIADVIKPEEETVSGSEEQSEDESIKNQVLEVFGEARPEDRLEEQLKSVEKLSNLELNIKNVKNLELIKEYLLKDHYNYIKKSLELQFKQTITLIDLRNRFGIFAKEQVELLKAIVRNTSLPDMVKLENKELLKHRFKENMIDTGINLITNNSFTKKLKDVVIDRLLDKINYTTDSLEMSSGMVTPIKELLSSLPPAERNAFIGEMISGEIISAGTSKIFNKIKNTKVGDKVLGKAGKTLQKIRSNPKSIIEKILPERAKNTNLYYTLTDILDELYQEEGIGNINLSKNNLEQAAVFDNKIKTTIITVIPNLLSKILNELVGIRTGIYNKDKELVFDYTANKFKEKGRFKEELVKELNTHSESFAKDMEYTSGKILKSLLGNNYTAKDIADLKRGLETIVLKGEPINPYVWVDEPEIFKYFKSRIRDKVKKAVEELVKSPTIESMEKINEIEKTLRRIKEYLTFRSSKLQAFVDQGLIEDLEDLKLIDKDSDVIDSETIQKLLRKGIETNTEYVAKKVKPVIKDTNKIKETKIETTESFKITDAGYLRSILETLKQIKSVLIDKLDKLIKTFNKQTNIKIPNEPIETKSIKDLFKRDIKELTSFNIKNAKIEVSSAKITGLNKVIDNFSQNLSKVIDTNIGEKLSKKIESIFTNIKPSEIFTKENIVKQYGKIKDTELYKKLNKQVESIKDSEFYKTISGKTENVKNYILDKFKDRIVEVENDNGEKNYMIEVGKYTLVLPAAALSSPIALYKALKEQVDVKDLPKVMKELLPTKETITDKFTNIKQEVNEKGIFSFAKSQTSKLFNKVKSKISGTKADTILSKIKIPDNIKETFQNTDMYDKLPDKLREYIVRDDNGDYVITVDNEIIKVDKEGLLKLLPVLTRKLETGTLNLKTSISEKFNKYKEALTKTGIGGSLLEITSDIRKGITDSLKNAKGTTKEALKKYLTIMFNGKNPLKDNLSLLDVAKAFTFGTFKSSFWFGRNVLRPAYKGIFKTVGNIAHNTAKTLLTTVFGFSPEVAEGILNLIEAPFKIVSKALKGIETVLKKTKEAFQGLFSIVGKLGKFFLSKGWSIVKKGLTFITGRSEDEIQTGVNLYKDKIKETGKNIHDKWINIENKGLLNKLTMYPIRKTLGLGIKAPFIPFKVGKALANTFIITDKEEENLLLNRKLRQGKVFSKNIGSAVYNNLSNIKPGDIYKYVDETGRTVVTSTLKHINNAYTNIKDNIVNKELSIDEQKEKMLSNFKKKIFKVMDKEDAEVLFDLVKEEITKMSPKEYKKFLDKTYKDFTNDVSLKTKISSKFSGFKDTIRSIKKNIDNYKENKRIMDSIKESTSKEEFNKDKSESNILSKISSIFSFRTTPFQSTINKVKPSLAMSRASITIPGLSTIKNIFKRKSKDTTYKEDMDIVKEENINEIKREKHIEELRDSLEKDKEDKSLFKKVIDKTSKFSIFGLIGLAIPLLKKIGGILFDISKHLFKWLPKLFTGIKNIGNVFLKGISSLKEHISSLFSHIGTGIKHLGSKAWDIVKNTTNKIKNTITKTKDFITDTKNESLLGKISSGVKNFASKAWDTVTNIFSKVKNVSGKVFDKAIDIVKHPWSSMKEAVSHLIDTPFVKNIVTRLREIFPLFKKKIIEKLGLEEGSKILAKISGRFIPGVGEALLLWDAGNVAWYMLHDHMKFLPAVSKDFLGFNIFKDDDKNTIKHNVKPSLDHIKNVPTPKPVKQPIELNKPDINITKPNPIIVHTHIDKTKDKNLEKYNEHIVKHLEKQTTLQEEMNENIKLLTKVFVERFGNKKDKDKLINKNIHRSSMNKIVEHTPQPAVSSYSTDF